MRPDLPEAPDLVAGLVDLAPTAHVVLLSEQGAANLPRDHWARQVEDAVTGRAGSWTILRPSWFHQVLTDPRFYRDMIRSERALTLPSGGAPIAWVDARDVAGVAVEALLRPDEHHGQAYTITGPEAVTVPAVAAALSAVIGQPVRALDPSIEDAIAGFDPWAAGIVGDLYQRVHQRGFADVTTTVEQITGKDATTIDRFIGDHRDQWLD